VPRSAHQLRTLRKGAIPGRFDPAECRGRHTNCRLSGKGAIPGDLTLKSAEVGTPTADFLEKGPSPGDLTLKSAEVGTPTADFPEKGPSPGDWTLTSAEVGTPAADFPEKAAIRGRFDAKRWVGTNRASHLTRDRECSLTRSGFRTGLRRLPRPPRAGEAGIGSPPECNEASCVLRTHGRPTIVLGKKWNNWRGKNTSERNKAAARRDPACRSRKSGRRTRALKLIVAPILNPKICATSIEVAAWPTLFDYFGENA
jgi:hypothetical protein